MEKQKTCSRLLSSKVSQWQSQGLGLGLLTLKLADPYSSDTQFLSAPVTTNINQGSFYSVYVSWDFAMCRSSARPGEGRGWDGTEMTQVPPLSSSYQGRDPSNLRIQGRERQGRIQGRERQGRGAHLARAGMGLGAGSSKLLLFSVFSVLLVLSPMLARREGLRLPH